MGGGKTKLTKRVVEQAEPTGTRYDLFDDELKGFALRVGINGHKAFYYFYRAGRGRSAPLKRLRLGTFPTMTVEQARHLAKEKAASVALGGDPSQEVKADKASVTMSQAVPMFVDEHVSRLKPNTQQSYMSIIDKHLRGVASKRKVKDITYSDIAKLHHDMKATPYLANRAIAILSKFFSWCELHGYRQRGNNPCLGIVKYKEHKRQEFMSAEVLSIIGDTISTMESTWHNRQITKEKRSSEYIDTITPQVGAAIRLLMLTGARVGEILSLEWERIDLERGTALLPDSKTGFKILQLTAPALAVLDSLPQVDKWVFPSNSASGHMANIKDAWRDILKQSGLSGWRLHDLRHAFASMMVNSGASLPIVGKILGHSNSSTTERYAHLEANPARQAAEQAAIKIAEAMNKKPQRGKVIPLQRAGNEDN